MIPIKVLPSAPENINIQIDENSLRPGEVAQGRVTIQDGRGNPYTESTEVNLESRGTLSLAQEDYVVT